MVFGAIDRASEADYGGDPKARDAGRREAVESVVREMTGYSPEHRLSGVVNQGAYGRVMRGLEGSFVDHAMADRVGPSGGRGAEHSPAAAAVMERDEMSAALYGASLNDMHRLQEALSFSPRFVERDEDGKAGLHADLGTTELKAMSEGKVEASEYEAGQQFRSGGYVLSVVVDTMMRNPDLVEEASLQHVQAMLTTVRQLESNHSDTTFVEPGLYPPAPLTGQGRAAMRDLVEVLEAIPEVDLRILTHAADVREASLQC